MTALSSVYLIPLYFQTVLAFSSTTSGLYLIPKIVASGLGSILTGQYMARTGRFYIITVLALGCMVVSETFIVARWNPPTSTPRPLEYISWIALDGIAFGGILTTVLSALLASVNKSDIAVCSSLFYLFRSAGSVVGIAVSQSIYTFVLKSALERAGLPVELVELVRKDIKEWRGSVDPVYWPVIVECFLSAFRWSLGCCVLFAVSSFGSGIFIKDIKMER
jgi:MFS family permease